MRRLSITSLFTLATLLPLVLVGVLLLILAVRTINESSESLGRDVLEESAERVDEDVRRYLDQSRRMSDLLAGLVGSQVLTTDGFEEWRDRLFIRLRVTPEVSSICFTTESFDTIYLMRYPPDMEYGEATGHEGGSTMRTYAARSDGTLSTEPSRVYEYDPRVRPWWIAGHTAADPVWTEPYQWFSTRERSDESVLAIAYTRSVRDRKGNRLGVLSIDATLDQVDRRLAEVSRRPGAFITITDSSDRLVSSSFAHKTVSLQPVSELSRSDSPQVRLVGEMFRNLQGPANSTFHIKLGDQYHWVRQVPLTIENGPTWMMTLVVPDEQLLQGAKSAVRVMKILGTIFLSLAVLSAVLLARTVANPFRKLARFAREIGVGEFNQRVEAGTTREFVELSQALNSMAENLQERVQILAQKDAAQEASAIKARLIAHVSHEFRTPLNAIIGYSEMVKEQAHEKGMERTEKDVGNILLASKHLLTLINNLLDLSRVEAGKMKIDTVTFSVRRLMEEVAETVRPVVEGNDNQFEVVTELADDRMISDPARIKQVLINLLGNAGTFTKQGRIEMTAVADQGDYIRFVVKDTGAGMSQEQLEQLFEPFSQVHSPGQSSQVGAGLGLAISRQLSELLGGNIVFESKTGHGTQASFRLPRFHRDRDEIAVH